MKVDINDFLSFILKETKSGRMTDHALLAVLPNVLNCELTFHKITLSSNEELLAMLEDADDYFIYLSNYPSIVAHYKFSENYPISRLYHIQYELFDLAKSAIYFKKQSIKLCNMNDEQLLSIVDASGAKQRIIEYLKSKKDVNFEKMKELFAGRQKVTCLENAIFLKSSSCFICGSKENLNTVTTTINTLMFGYTLCYMHFMEAENKNLSFINYLFFKYLEIVLFESKDFSPESHFNQIVEWLPKASDLKVKKVTMDKKTVTLERETGITLILRLTAPLDYAYTIKDKNGIEIIRVDSAKHHSEVDFAPDHLHYHPKTTNEIMPSFTTGTPFFDLKGIIKLIKDIEESQ